MTLNSRVFFIRSADLVIGTIALIVFAPLMLLIAGLIAVLDPGPIIFRHKRVGKDGREFACFKFRTMVTDAEERLHSLLASDSLARSEWDADRKLRSDPRITQLGAFLRKSSLDELPQLANVLRGEMSLVGPRPITQCEALKYGRYIAHYQSAKPGVTGLWQVSGRNSTTYRRRVALDVAWARHQCPVLYLRILGKTVPAVLWGRGSY